MGVWESSLVSTALTFKSDRERERTGLSAVMPSSAKPATAVIAAIYEPTNAAFAAVNSSSSCRRVQWCVRVRDKHTCSWVAVIGGLHPLPAY